MAGPGHTLGPQDAGESTGAAHIDDRAGKRGGSHRVNLRNVLMSSTSMEFVRRCQMDEHSCRLIRAIDRHIDVALCRVTHMTDTVTPLLPRGPRVSNTEEVYTRLREMLLNGEIPPGTVLSQVKLARQLGVSTTPLREAMRLVQAEGLLIAEHNQRSRVAPMDPKDIDAVYASRILMEALAIRLTVPALTAADDDALRADLHAMEEAARAQDISTWEPLHRTFHRRLINGSDPALTRIIDPLVDRCERYRRTSLFGSPARAWELGNKEHEAIVAACEARDANQAALLLARHFGRSALTVLAIIAPEENPEAVRSALHLVSRATERP